MHGVRPMNAERNLTATEVLSALRRDGDACPFCGAATLDRVPNEDACEVLCDHCSRGWTEKRRDGRVIAVALDDGTTATE